MNLKPMIYSNNLAETEILAYETLNTPMGLLTYYIVNYGSHPACYISIPNEHIFYNKDEDDISKICHIDCHGGISYTGDTLPRSVPKYDEKSSTIPVWSTGWYIGWDYMHYTDYRLSPLYVHEGKKWTTEEMIADCYDVINQLCTANCG